jgi:hypothetical protein
VLDQSLRIEQVSRGFADRPASPSSCPERCSRDVLDVVLLA